MHSTIKTLDSFFAWAPSLLALWAFTHAKTQQQPWKEVNPPLVDWLNSLTIENIPDWKNCLICCLLNSAAHMPQLCGRSPKHSIYEYKSQGLQLPRGTEGQYPGKATTKSYLWGRPRLNIITVKRVVGVRCSGKGFLGQRILSQQSSQKVTSFWMATIIVWKWPKNCGCTTSRNDLCARWCRFWKGRWVFRQINMRTACLWRSTHVDSRI